MILYKKSNGLVVMSSAFIELTTTYARSKHQTFYDANNQTHATADVSVPSGDMPTWYTYSEENGLTLNAIGTEEKAKSEAVKIEAERDVRVAQATAATNRSQDFLLMKAAKINNIRAAGNRPPTQDELDEENALMLIVEETERLYAVADEAIANGSNLEDVDWG